MEDRIEGVNDKSLVYQFLDKIVKVLNSEEESKISLYREGTHDGMNIIVWTKDNEKMVKIESNLDAGVLNITLINKAKDDKHWCRDHPWFDSKGYNFATLYKDNSLSCKNFLIQIQKENKKIDEMLSDMLKELDKLGEPKIEPKITEEKINNVSWWQLWKMWHSK